MFIFGSLKALLPKFNATVIDNFIFRLHYRFTVLILVAFIILATGREFIGDPIRCHTADRSVPAEVLDQFCWVQSTYSLPDFWHKKVGEDIPYDGVGHYKPGMQQVYHKYYQWVAFMLFVQAITFYVPRYVWKIAEGGKIKMLLLDLDKPLMDQNVKHDKVNSLVHYFAERLRTHRIYAISYIGCEILNLINIVGQIYLTDRFLGYTFTTFGPDVIKFATMDQQSRTDPMVMVFPRMTKCTFLRFGMGGDFENKEAICILPLNIVNEKIYVFLWFWFVILAAFTSINIVYRLIMAFIPKVRAMAFRVNARFVPSATIQLLASKFEYADWFVLYLLSKNMDPLHFRDFTRELTNKNLGQLIELTKIRKDGQAFGSLYPEENV